MKRNVCYLLMSFLTICAMAQNSKVEQYLERLAERGAKVSVARINDESRLGRRYHLRFENVDILQGNEVIDSSHHVPALVDSICLFLDGMALNSVEAYRYNKRSCLCDTITYSLSLRAYGENEDYVIEPEATSEFYSTPMNERFRQYHSGVYENSYTRYEKILRSSLKGKNRRAFMGAKELILFDYVNGRGNLIYMNNVENDEYRSFFNFHMEPFDSVLASAMAEVKVRKHKVEYTHRDDESLDRNSAYYYTEELLYGSNFSHSKGTLYVVDAPDEARHTYERLFHKAYSHMDREKGQACVMEYSNRHFSLCGVKSINRLKVNNDPRSSYVIADLGNDGRLYVLRLEVEGEYWIPKDWKRVYMVGDHLPKKR